MAEAHIKSPPSYKFNIEINIDFEHKEFSLKVDGKEYLFKKNCRDINLIDEIDKDKRIGWFNELSPVKLSNIKIE